MSQALSKIKTRIKSVSGAYKVTSAMKLVSNVKLKQWKSKMLANKEYNALLEETVEDILRCANKVTSPYCKINTDAKKNLYVVITSSLGLCGSYNANIFKIADVELKKEDDAIILGSKGIAHFVNGQFKQLEGFDNYSSNNNKIFVENISSYVLSEYVKGTYKEIHIIYSEYKNSLVFLASDFKLLPLGNLEENNEIGYPPIMEPSQKELVDTLVPLYIKNAIFSKLLESNVCEEASRANAMENATDNAKEILDDLQIEFNKARQAAITQEITEISAAANAL